jgi:hypothetical protein
MTGGPGATDAPRALGEDERAREQSLFGLGQEERRQLLAWVGENLTEVRQTADGKRPVYWVLWTGLAVGLAAYIGGYLIKSSTTAALLGLVGDLLYTFGWALWTGVVVVVFLQIIPEIKRRQYKAALDAYEATLREQAGARNDEASPDQQVRFDQPTAG